MLIYHFRFSFFFFLFSIKPYILAQYMEGKERLSGSVDSSFISKGTYKQSLTRAAARK